MIGYLEIRINRLLFMLDNIGIFCFRNTIEKELEIPKYHTVDTDRLVKMFSSKKEHMKSCATIKKIQKFIDKLN